MPPSASLVCLRFSQPCRRREGAHADAHGRKRAYVADTYTMNACVGIGYIVNSIQSCKQGYARQHEQDVCPPLNWWYRYSGTVDNIMDDKYHAGSFNPRMGENSIPSIFSRSASFANSVRQGYYFPSSKSDTRLRKHSAMTREMSNSG